MLITCTPSKVYTTPLSGTANHQLPTFVGQLKRAVFTKIPKTYTMSSKACAFSRKEKGLSSKQEIISRDSRKETLEKAVFAGERHIHCTARKHWETGSQLALKPQPSHFRKRWKEKVVLAV